MNARRIKMISHCHDSYIDQFYFYITEKVKQTRQKKFELEVLRTIE